MDVDDRDRFPEYGCYGRAKVVCEWIAPGTLALLDAGCAYGYGTRFFAERAVRTVGIDPNAQLIEIARRRYPAIEFAVSDIERVPFDAAIFDVVVMADVLEHVRNERQTLNEVFRLLKPGGTFIVTVPHRGLFSFLDLDNLTLAFRRLVPLVYDRLYRRKEGEAPRAKPGYEDWHRHYSERDILRLLDESDFRERFVVTASRRWGLFIGPIMDIVINVTRLAVGIRRARRLSPVFDAIQGFEDNVRAGRSSYNLGLRIQKKV
jgi:SAM-dependent methyltransferase